MMWWWLNKAVLIICSLSGLIGFSQSVPVTDTVVRQFFCENYPEAMSSDCSLLDTALLNSTFTTPQLINLNNSGVKDLEELLYFKAADTLFFRFNDLTEFPSDLRSVFPIRRLDLRGNSLTEVPTYLVDEANRYRRGIALIYFYGNQIAELPSEWSGSNKSTQVIDLRNNFLSDLPTFVEYEELRALRISYNFLSFEDLIPIKANPRYDATSYQFFPQKPFDLFINRLAYSEGESITINVDRGLPSNHYFLMKDNVEIDSNRTGEFKLRFKKGEDFGEYAVRIRNDEFLGKDDYLESMKYDFKRILYKKDDVYIFSPNNDGIEDDFSVDGEGRMVIVDERGSEVRSEKLPFVWKGDDSQGSPLPPGLYLLKKENQELLQIFIAY